MRSPCRNHSRYYLHRSSCRRGKQRPFYPLTATMTNVLSEKKRASLAALYHDMPIEELERRIAEGQLAAPTMAIAREVLHNRLEHGDSMPELSLIHI